MIKNVSDKNNKKHTAINKSQRLGGAIEYNATGYVFSQFVDILFASKSLPGRARVCGLCVCD